MQPCSCIIATTSEQVYDPAANLYDYAQTKAATMNYVKSLAKQLGPKGIRVNGVAPGPIWTVLTRGSRHGSSYAKLGVLHPSEKLEAMEAVLPPSLRRRRFKAPEALIASLQGSP
jgi:NAD(P)-dependent dehydrogenase (short-subunit alcohol dehydrogenase family)